MTIAQQTNPTPSPPLRPRSSTSAMGCLHHARGWLLLITSIGTGSLGWWVLILLHASLRENPDHAANVGEFVRWMTEHASVVLLLSLPPAVIGVWLGMVASRRSLFWVLWAVGMIWALVLFAAVLITFIKFLTPLYQYQPL